MDMESWRRPKEGRTKKPAYRRSGVDPKHMDMEELLKPTQTHTQKKQHKNGEEYPTRRRTKKPAYSGDDQMDMEELLGDGVPNKKGGLKKPAYSRGLVLGLNLGFYITSMN
ncbi:hypothetical protein J6590_046211 [Homalodisca vitripennis]|nr:hypothetical protein J6590_046211 [Homalodisca vitripennis]